MEVADESKIKVELSELELRIGLEYWQEKLLTETGKVLVDTLAEFEFDDFWYFFLRNFLFSAFRLLISDFDLLRLSERLSIFWQHL